MGTALHTRHTTDRGEPQRRGRGRAIRGQKFQRLVRKLGRQILWLGAFITITGLAVGVPASGEKGKGSLATMVRAMVLGQSGDQAGKRPRPEQAPGASTPVNKTGAMNAVVEFEPADSTNNQVGHVILGSLASRNQCRALTISSPPAPFTMTAAGNAYSFLTDVAYSAIQLREGKEQSILFSAPPELGPPYEFTRGVVNQGGRSGVWELTSQRIIIALQGPNILNACGTNVPAYGTVFGPQMYSKPFYATSGMALSYDWSAEATPDTGDDYEAYGFLVRLSSSTSYTGTSTLLSYGRGKTQPWTTAAGTITQDGWYRFRFVNGSYDATGGGVVGASMYIDRTVIVGLPNTINFTQPPDTARGSSRVITASATSGSAVTFTSQTTSVCTVGGSTTSGGVSTATVSSTSTAGTCSIAANSPSTSTYIAAPTVVRRFSFVEPGPPTQLVIVTQPVAGVSGVLSTKPVLEIRDANGFRTTSTAQVSVSIFSGTGGSLSGTTALNASGGVANFSNLGLNGRVGEGYVLRFSATLSTGQVTVNSISVAPTGFGAAAKLVITRAPVAAESGEVMTTQPRVEVRDNGENLVSNSSASVAIAIHSGSGGALSGTLSVNASSGVATFSNVRLAGLLGTNYQLRFTSSSLSQAVSGNVTPTGHGVATQMTMTTQPGGRASGTVLIPQPVVAVRDSAGNLVADSAVAVTVAIHSGANGELGGTLTVNADGGVATFSGVTLAGRVSTSYVLRFSSGSLTAATANGVTVTPGTPTQLAVTTQPVPGPSATAMTTPPVVRVQDAQGNTVTSSTAQVAVELVGEGGTLSGPQTINASSGVATFSGLTLTGVVGTSYVLQFTSDGLTQANSVGVTPSRHGVATQLTMTTQPGGAASGTRLTPQPVVTLRDSAGNTVANSTAAVTVALPPGSNGTLGGTLTVNAVGGIVTFNNVTLAGKVLTPYVLGFRSGSLPEISADPVMVTPGAPTQLAITMEPVPGVSGAELTTQPVVEIRDAQENTVTGSSATVAVEVVGAGGMLGGTTSVDAVDGVVTFSGVTLAGVLGTNYILRFTAAGLTQIDSVGVTPTGHGVATQLAVTTQPGGAASATVLTPQPVVTVQDSAGNTVANSTVPVTVALPPGSNGTLGGTLTVNAVSGIVTFSGVTLAGKVFTPYVLGFSSGSLTVASANAVTVTPGTPTQLAVTTQPVPGPSATVLTTSPVVHIQDAQGNTVTSSTATVAVQLVGEGGTLSGPLTSDAVSGVATFNGLNLAGLVGTSYVFEFTSTGLTQADSAGVTPSMHGVATQLTLTTQPGGAASATELTPQPVVTVRDSAGNKVANSTVPVTIALPPGSNGTLGGTLTVNADGGVATFSGVTLAGKVLTPYVLGFSSGSLTAVSANSVMVTPGTPTHLAITTPPVAEFSGSPLVTQPVAEIRDAQENRVTSSTAAVTIAIHSGTGGSLSGTTTINAVGGVATFTGLTLSGTYNTVYVLRFSSPGLTPADTSGMTVRVLVVLSITRGGASPSSAESLSWTITFSEELTGLTAANLALTGSSGAEIREVSGSGRTWTVTAYPGMAGSSVGMSVVNGAGVVGPARLPLSALPFTTSVGDAFIIAPRIMSIDQMSPNPVVITGLIGAQGTRDIFFDVHFNEVVTGLTLDNFELVGTSAVQSQWIPMGPAGVLDLGTGMDYRVSVKAGGTGTVALQMKNSTGVQDLEMNPVLSPAIPYTSPYYLIAPRVLSIAAANPNPARTQAVAYTVKFSEPVTGLTTNDFRLDITGPAGASITGLSGSGDTWTVAVDFGTSTGRAALRMTTGSKVKDSDDVAVAASTLPFLGETYRIAPRVISILRAGPEFTAESITEFQVTFSEAVTGLNKDNFDPVFVAEHQPRQPEPGRVTQAVIDTITGSGAFYTIRLLLPEARGSVGLSMTNSNGTEDVDKEAVSNLSFTTGERVSLIAVGASIAIGTAQAENGGEDLLRLSAGTQEKSRRIYNGDVFPVVSTMQNRSGVPKDLKMEITLPESLRAIPWNFSCLTPSNRTKTCTIDSPRRDLPGLVMPVGDGENRTAEVGIVHTTLQTSASGSPFHSQTVTWEGTLGDEETLTFRFWVQVANEALPQQASKLTATAYFQGTAVRSVLDTLAPNFTMAGPGSLALGLSPSNGLKLGSVLIYPFYSSSVNRARQDTRFTLTNTDPERETSVHLFFVDGSDCSVADRFVTLTANQTTSFLASDLDPMITGYMIAVAVNENGCPRFFNHLIGEVLVKTESGHAANLPAIGVSALAGGQRPCAWTDVTTELRLDGISYNELPRTLALSNLGSRADGNNGMLVINRIGGSLAGAGAEVLGPLFGVLYDDVERGASFTMAGTSCQMRTMLSDSVPRTVPRMDVMIPAGRSGWMKISSGDDPGIVGVYLNENPKGFSQGHVLHALTTTRSVVITIPIVRPDTN